MNHETCRRPGAGRYQVLIGAVIVQLILGTVYGYSIFWQPLQAKVFPTIITEAEYADLSESQRTANQFEVVPSAAQAATRRNVQQGYLKYAFSICILSFAVVMVIAGRVQDVRGPRLPALIGAMLMGGGFLIAGLMNYQVVFYLAHALFVGTVAILVLMIFHALFSRVDQTTVPILKYAPTGVASAAVVAGVLLGDQYVGKLGEVDRLFLLWGTVGFLAGAGIGFAYVCPLAALIKWFPDHKGLVSGLAVTGFGFGAFLFKAETLGAFGFLKTHSIEQLFVVHGLVSLVVVAAGAMLLRNPPGTVQAAVAAPSDTAWQDTLRSPAFHVLWIMFFSGAMAGLMVIGIVKVFAGEQLVASALATGEALDDPARRSLLDKGAAAVGWLAIFNALGRVTWGLISDRIGRTASFVAMFTLQAVMMFLLISMRSELSLAIAASIVGFNFGGNFALFPSATADRFGARNMGVNYGWVFTSYGIAGVVGIAAGNVAKTMTGSYAAAFALAGALCLVSAGLAIYLQWRLPPTDVARA
ncbi:MAG: MFS transporter [Phycisphaeraceae bacterium]|nr:MFS transporter [Phycisphaeraceae bacterium]